MTTFIVVYFIYDSILKTEDATQQNLLWILLGLTVAVTILEVKMFFKKGKDK